MYCYIQCVIAFDLSLLHLMYNYNIRLMLSAYHLILVPNVSWFVLPYCHGEFLLMEGGWGLVSGRSRKQLICFVKYLYLMVDLRKERVSGDELVLSCVWRYLVIVLELKLLLRVGNCMHCKL